MTQQYSWPHWRIQSPVEEWQIKIQHTLIRTNYMNHSGYILHWQIRLPLVTIHPCQCYSDNTITVCSQPEMCPCRQHDRRWRFVVLVLRADGWCWVRWLWDTDSDLHLWSAQYHGSGVALAQRLWWNRCHCCRSRDKIKNTCKNKQINMT